MEYDLTMEERERILKSLAEGYSSLGYTALFEAMSSDDENAQDLEALKILDFSYFFRCIMYIDML